MKEPDEKGTEQGKERAKTNAQKTGNGRGRRKSRSFVLRLSLAQTMRTIRLMLLADLLVVALILGLYVMEMNHAAGVLVTSREEFAEEILVEIPGKSKARFAANLPELVGKALDKVPGNGQTLALYGGEPNPDLFGWGYWPEYTIPVESEEGVTRVRFGLSRQLGWLCWGLLALLSAETLLLIGNSLGFRRSAKRTLAPIQQLAAATQSISAEQGRPRQSKAVSPPAGRSGAQRELELSETIDALNQITAKHLDTRIQIDNEREELRGLAGAINSMLDRLDAAYSSQLRFVSDASHELRTPIAVIQGYANLLDRWGKEDPEALQESIDAIKAEAEGMKALVEQLLFLARSDNNSIVIQRSHVDISSLCEEVLRDAQLIDREHQFQLDVAPALFVEGDAGLLKQAMRIFMDNAVKYTPSGEEIRISAKRDSGCVRVSVTDNGIGIPEEDVPHVFERFFRSDDSRARATGGTGLGLSIAKWTVQRHGGYLEVISRKDVGTRLTMVLPEAEAGQQEDAG